MIMFPVEYAITPEETFIICETHEGFYILMESGTGMPICRSYSIEDLFEEIPSTFMRVEASPYGEG